MSNVTTAAVALHNVLSVAENLSLNSFDIVLVDLWITEHQKDFRKD